MNGTCQCGGRIKERSHTVTTERGAKEHGINLWPVVIEVSECMACGRSMTKTYSPNIGEQKHDATEDHSLGGDK